MSRRYLALCAVASLLLLGAAAEEWSEAEEAWLSGTGPAGIAFKTEDLLQGGVIGTWSTYAVDYTVQDEFLKELGTDWATRTALSYSKPTYVFSKKTMDSNAIDAANKAKVPSPAGSDIPVLEFEQQVFVLKTLLEVRLDGHAFNHLEDGLSKVHWTTRAALLKDGRFVKACHSDIGVTRELFVPLTRDPKGEQAGPVLYYEVHFFPKHPSGSKQHFTNAIWLVRSASLNAQADEQRQQMFLQ